MREVDPKQTSRADAFEMWMKAPMLSQDIVIQTKILTDKIV